jgi:hypothetical protein
MAKCRLSARTATPANRPRCKAVQLMQKGLRKPLHRLCRTPDIGNGGAAPVRLWSNLRPIVTRFEREPPPVRVSVAWGRIMTKHVRTRGFAAFGAVVLPVGMLLLAEIQTADAKQCRATMPSNPQGHWTYRLVDGRKCWYEGESKISKSLLQWSAPAHIRSARLRRDEKRLPAETPTVSKNTETPNNTQISESETFEARWRPVEMTPSRN